MKSLDVLLFFCTVKLRDTVSFSYAHGCQYDAVEGLSLATAYVVPHELFAVSSAIDDQVDSFFNRPIAKRGIDLLKTTKDTFSSAVSSLWSVANKMLSLRL